jgi:hypothetical protein
MMPRPMNPMLLMRTPYEFNDRHADTEDTKKFGDAQRMKVMSTALPLQHYFMAGRADSIPVRLRKI